MIDRSILNSEPPQVVARIKKQSLLTRVAYSMSALLLAFTFLIMVVDPIWTTGRVVCVVAAAFLAAIGYMSRNLKYYTFSAVSLVAIFMIAGFMGSITNGGVIGFVASTMIIAPVASGLFLSTRATIVSAVAVIAMLITLTILQPMGVIQPSSYSPEVLPIVGLIWLSTVTIISTAGVGYFARDSEKKIAELTDYQRKVLHVAQHDTLTGVANRQGLQLHFNQVRAQQADPGAQICVIHIDLDRFKAINDTYGHPVGDAVLCQSAETMTQLCCDDSFVARIGGDEFVIVYLRQSEIASKYIQAFCDKLITALNRPVNANGVKCAVGASIGFAVSDLATCCTETIMMNADVALYDAKNAGRGLAREFSSAMRKQMTDERSIKHDLETAFAEDRIICFLQPQVCIKSGDLLGVESLARIRSQSGDLLSPAAFLEPLEEMGRLADLDDRVAAKSLDTLVELRRAGLDVPSISINASASALRSPDYAQNLIAKLQARGLTCDSLVVEILESVLIEDSGDVASDTIAELRASGIRVVMDDFGAGNATIANLLRLDLDGLKIDRSLITNLEQKRSQRVVQSLIHLAQSFDLPAVVEGVESAQQHAVLKSIGYTAAQGFGICRPKPLDEFIAWTQERQAPEVLHLQTKAQGS